MDGLATDQTSVAIEYQEAIHTWVKVYMELIHPSFPVFHDTTFRSQVRNNFHLVDDGFSASLMAACALAASRVRDGAMTPSLNVPVDPGRHASQYLLLAQQALPQNLSTVENFGFLQAYELLACLSIGDENMPAMYQYLGIYHRLCESLHLYDERMWPRPITETEQQERRKLFWTMCRLDMFVAANFHSVLRFREAEAKVNCLAGFSKTTEQTGIRTCRHPNQTKAGTSH